MITQHYKLPASLDNIRNGRPGQFVHESNDSDDIIGFVDFVSDSHIAFMLFEPKEIRVEGAINISSKLDCRPRFKEIIDNDEEIKQLWIEVFTKLLIK